MKTALVTGSAGFAGRHYVKALADSGYSVFGIDIAYGGDARMAGYQPGISRARGQDARDYFRHEDEWFDLAIHCAAVVGGRAVIEGSPLAQAVNLELDASLFQWAERTKPGQVIYISSSAAYPVRLQKTDGIVGCTPLREEHIDLTDPDLPDELYGWAKLTGEMLADRYRRAGGAVLVIRPFSGYGEDQDESYPFRAFAERAKRREDPFVIWGTGEQVRDFIHIDDVVNGSLVMASDGHSGPLNLGTGHGTTMLDLAGMMCTAAGYQPVVQVLPFKPAGVAYRVADPTRMLECYDPLISLKEGVKRAVTA